MRSEEKIIAEDELSTLKSTVYHPETKEEVYSLLSQDGRECFWDELRSLAEACDSHLADLGWPTSQALILCRDNGKWKAFSRDEFECIPQGWNLTRGGLFVQRQTKDLSDAWYAARIAWKCWLILEHVSKGQAKEPFLHKMVFEVSHLRTDWQWRGTRKSQILTGKKQRATLSEHRLRAIQVRKDEASQRRSEVAKLLSDTKLKGGALEAYLQRRLRDEAGIAAGLRTIRRDIKAIQSE